MHTIPGIDILLTEKLDLLAGRRVGLISSASGVTRDLTPTVEALRRTPGVNLVALFAPEHGFFAALADGAHIESNRDPRTGLPVHSLYGATYIPTAEMLADIDLLVFDIHSVGVRFYTYITTLLNCMQAAAEHGVAILVCDRPNPIGGQLIEGPILQAGFESFVGPGPIPIRHGMTIGELARLYNDSWRVGCELTVVPCANWSRDQWYDQTGLAWVPQSPSMPKLETAVVYPGMCLIEGTNLSEGRGTATPFEVAGSPWVDGWVLAERLNSLELEGVRFRPTYFEPSFSKWTGQVCGGVHVHVLDRTCFRPVPMALHLMAAVKVLWPEQFALRAGQLDRLSGSDALRKQLDADIPVDEIVGGWPAQWVEFAAQRRAALLYS